jgi:hypothetical protein
MSLWVGPSSWRAFFCRKWMGLFQSAWRCLHRPPVRSGLSGFESLAPAGMVWCKSTMSISVSTYEAPGSRQQIYSRTGTVLIRRLREALHDHDCFPLGHAARIHMRNFDAMVYVASTLCSAPPTSSGSKSLKRQCNAARHASKTPKIYIALGIFMHITAAYRSTCLHPRILRPPSSRSQSSSSPSPPSPCARCASAPRTRAQTATPRYPPCSSPPLP